MSSLPIADRAAILRYVRPLLARRHLLLVATAATFLGGAVVSLAAPLALGTIVDSVAAGATSSAILWPATIIGVAAVLQGLAAMAAPAMSAHALEPVLAGLREDVVAHSLRAPAEIIERGGTGDLLARVDGDVAAVTEGVRAALPELTTAGLMIVLSLVGIIALDWRLGLAALAAVPVQWHTLRWYLPRSSPVYAAERAAAGARTTQLLETVAAADTVRAFGRGDDHVALVGHRSTQAADLVKQATRLRTRFFARLNLAEVTGVTAILVTGFWLVDTGRASVGAVTAAVLFFHRLFDPINVVLFTIDVAQAAGAALARLVGVLQIPAPAEPAVHSAVPPTVDIDGLGFAYDVGHPVLADVSLHLGAGEHVAVVGVSGAGKSTLAKLIAAMQSPTVGSVRVAGTAVDELASVAGRTPVAVVTQDIHVHAGTIADDLRLADPTASEATLNAALDQVGASGWIERLPERLATVVGDGGHPLSADQAQQLALARLILADPCVAILDEATAEAGSAGAKVLDRAAATAIRGRTAVVIAHRLSQAVQADRIAVIEAGRIVQLGTHADLVEVDGTYARMWQAGSSGRHRR